MKSKFLIIVTILVLVTAIQAEKICELLEVGKLEQLHIRGNRAYLAEDIKIHIYDLQKRSFQSTFGKMGEGPGEYPSRMKLLIDEKRVVVDGRTKVLFFSSMGKYIRELKKPFECSRLLPVKKNYVGFTANFVTKKAEDIVVYYLWDHNFKNRKKIGIYLWVGELMLRIRKGGKYDRMVPRMQKPYLVYNDQIFLGDPEKGIHFEVFDSAGNLLKTITNDYRRPKLTQAWKEDYITQLKKQKEYPQLMARYNMVFEKNLPAFERFIINNNLLYLITYLKENRRRKCLVINMSGKIIKTTSVRDIRLELIDIQGDFIYYAIENDEEDVWELHRENILIQD